MKKTSTFQEILLMTGSSFAARQWAETDESSEQKRYSETEKLENACWNGLMKEVLPEVFIEDEDGRNLYLWQVTSAQSFLNLELGTLPALPAPESSLNPYLFISALNLN